MLNNWRVSIPDDADVLSLYQSVVQKEKIKDGMHPFQKHAREMLDMMGVEVPIGGNVLSIYQKELLALGVHPWQVHVRTKLVEMDEEIEDDANVLSLYQKKLMKENKHSLQKYAAMMLAIMGIPVPVDGDANRIYQKTLFDLGIHNFQHVSEEQNDKRDINMRLSKMAKALPEWKRSYADFCIQFPENGDRPTNRDSVWFKNQKAAGTQGLRNKAEFEETYMSDEWLNQWNANNAEKLMGTEWRDNRDMFNQVLMKRWEMEY
jgi:hypothetical protein